MLDMFTHNIPTVPYEPGQPFVTATQAVQTIQGIGHGTFSASVLPQSGLAAVPSPTANNVLFPAGNASVHPFGKGISGYSAEMWVRRVSRSLDASNEVRLFGMQLPRHTGGIAVDFLLPSCIRVYIVSTIIERQGDAEKLVLYRTQVCDSTLAPARWHQVVIEVNPAGFAQIWLNGNLGLGWSQGSLQHCEFESPALVNQTWTLVDGDPGFYCGRYDPPWGMALTPSLLPPLGLAIGQVDQLTEFGSVAHIAVYPDHNTAFERNSVNFDTLPQVIDGEYVVVNTSASSFFLGRPTVAVVCSTKSDILVGGPVQRVWMGAWSGETLPETVACQPPTANGEQPVAPWEASVPEGWEPFAWGYRAIVTVPINFDPAQYPPGSVEEDGLEIDIQEELTALLVHMDPARLDVHFQADATLAALSPPAMRLTITFSPMRSLPPGISPWGPPQFQEQSAINSAVSVARQFHAMLLTPEWSVFGDRLWMLLPTAGSGITLSIQEPCPDIEGGFASACPAASKVAPIFGLALAVFAVTIVFSVSSACLCYDGFYPDERGALRAVRVVDAGWEEDSLPTPASAKRPIPATDAPLTTDREFWVGTASHSSSSHQQRRLPALDTHSSLSRSSSLIESSAIRSVSLINMHRAMQDSVRSTKPEAQEDEMDRRWTPAFTSAEVVERVRAGRDARWKDARKYAQSTRHGRPVVRADHEALTSRERGDAVRQLLQSPRWHFVAIPGVTISLVLMNVGLFVEMCLEQNASAAIVLCVGLLGWVAVSTLAACARHTSMERPLWTRGEITPDTHSCGMCYSRLLCCAPRSVPPPLAGGTRHSPMLHIGMPATSHASGATARSLSASGACCDALNQGLGVMCSVSCCWCCWSRTQLGGVLCGVGGPRACMRDTFGLGCSCAQSLVEEARLQLQESTPTEDPELLRAKAWATASVAPSSGCCGACGGEVVRGLARLNGDEGAAEWGQRYPMCHTALACLSILFGPMIVQIVMSRALPWGLCSLTWSIDGDYLGAGADVLRRQSLLGTFILFIMTIIYSAAMMGSVASATTSPGVVPPQWTMAITATLTVLWALYVFVSSLFSRFISGAAEITLLSGFPGARSMALLQDHSVHLPSVEHSTAGSDAQSVGPYHPSPAGSIRVMDHAAPSVAARAWGPHPVEEEHSRPALEADHIPLPLEAEPNRDDESIARRLRRTTDEALPSVRGTVVGGSGGDSQGSSGGHIEHPSEGHTDVGEPSEPHGVLEMPAAASDMPAGGLEIPSDAAGLLSGIEAPLRVALDAPPGYHAPQMKQRDISQEEDVAVGGEVVLEDEQPKAYRSDLS
jgi:hypothetical protein